MSFGTGIDFGTTNSVAAVYDNNNKICLPLTSKSTNLPHPSVVWYKADGSVVVGSKAKHNIFGFSNVAGHQFITSIKRTLGHQEAIRIFSEKKTNSEVASQIFQHIFNSAHTEYNRQLNEAVVTVPIYFNGRARRALRRAADLAGIYIKTFIHEPFAAIVGYCHEDRSGLKIKTLQDKLFLVFDWGGGTLDITVVHVKDGSITQLSTAGMPDCAGDLFDEKICKFATQRFAERLSIKMLDINPLPGNKDRLRIEAERAKITLSESDKSDFQVASFWNINGQMHSINDQIERIDFENLIRNEAQNAMGHVGKALEDAGVTENDIDCVLLIGGSSKVPIVKELLLEKFGSRLEYVRNADTIIAEGAAIIDAYGLQASIAHSLCVEMADGTQHNIFNAGDIANQNVLSKTLNFICTDNRDGEARLVIGEKQAGDGKIVVNKEILSIPVSSDLPKPYNHERITVDFAMDRDMVLHISGKGATQVQKNSCELYDLCFGLTLEGATI